MMGERTGVQETLFYGFKLKQFRGIATRYDKLKSTFLVAEQLVSATRN